MMSMAVKSKKKIQTPQYGSSSAVTHSVFQRLKTALLKHDNAADLSHALHVVEASIAQLSEADLAALLGLAETFPTHPNYPFLMDSFLFHATQEPRYLINMAERLRQYHQPAAAFHNLLWQVFSQFFQFSAKFSLGQQQRLLDKILRPQYHEVLASVRSSLYSMREKPKKQKRPLKRVAILSPQFLSAHHAPSRKALNIGAHLHHEHGIEVHQLINNCLPTSCPQTFYQSIQARGNPQLEGRQTIGTSYLDFPEVNTPFFTLPQGAFSLPKVDALFSYIEEHCIDGLITIGDNYLYTDLLTDVLPSLYIPTGSGVPFAQTDVIWLNEEAVTDYDRELAQSLGFQTVHEGLFLFSILGKGQDATKTDFHLPENSFVYAVVGGRLTQELTDEFVHFCHELLETVPQAMLLFAGTKELELERYFKREVWDRVQNVGFQRDLRGFYGACDAYLNPFRKGGGTSGQMALLEGVPVITLKEGDVGSAAGEAIALEDKNAYKELALTLPQQQAEQERLKQLGQSRIQTRFNASQQVAEMVELLSNITV